VGVGVGNVDRMQPAIDRNATEAAVETNSLSVVTLLAQLDQPAWVVGVVDTGGNQLAAGRVVVERGCDRIAARFAESLGGGGRGE
jgi:hypothetical protein